MGKKNSMNLKEIPTAEGLKFAVIKSEWNENITNKLKDGCILVLKEKGVKAEDIFELDVPGTFELPMAASLVIRQKSPDAVICLGCVVKGQTRHDEYISQAVSKGIMDVSLANNTPVIFGVLTTEDMTQAEDRAGGEYGNKGIEAAATAIVMARLYDEYEKSQSNIGFKR